MSVLSAVIGGPSRMAIVPLFGDTADHLRPPAKTSDGRFGTVLQTYTTIESAIPCAFEHVHEDEPIEHQRLLGRIAADAYVEEIDAAGNPREFKAGDRLKRLGTTDTYEIVGLSRPDTQSPFLALRCVLSKVGATP